MKKNVVILVVLVFLLITVVPASAKNYQSPNKLILESVNIETRIIEICYYFDIWSSNCLWPYVAENAIITIDGVPGRAELEDLPTLVYVHVKLEDGVVTHLTIWPTKFLRK